MEDKKIQRMLKRLFDICFSILLFIGTSPVLLIAIVIVKLYSSESPAFFKQVRVGYKCKLFTIYKLRSMTNERDENGELLPDHKRLKTWGKVIRKTNIDEIPQVINILKGEMSLIGPRPVLPSDVEKFNKYQLRRQDALPGISGWEAVNEWNTPTWEKKFEYDIYYVDNFSLWLDFKIILKTIYVVFLAKRPGEDYRPARFEGNSVFQRQKPHA
ncbi:sugar transferase [Sporomusa acidovorans]|uniref:Sugar transferase EpsL n=1 Tax=Sporomusa acidovorans (strain ATCC 49682 / DSM 3132 / Mol) TaxID=1123286 RepID=A0ABZ3IZJ5_SPOA4|nr:sugar transferase [Sporomusa acidovorans]OZC17236.1 putative sugar transferase EpsL [Sporomusa acidovorans DSM 3132]SDF15369.1 Sugar transferase involved in LPS biosynthesis (colanic, teichoic acid) [Sporomusa acidovorans]